MQDINLNEIQRRGIEQFELTLPQVQTPNFGVHTLNAIGILRQNNPEQYSNNQAAFNEVQGLNRIQTEGLIEYDLTRQQVETANFGAHTLEAIDTLQNRNEDLSIQEAFNQVQNLNRIQIDGLLHYGLNRWQVETPNFGRHSLNTLDRLRQANPALFISNERTFDTIAGLNEPQIDGIFYYNLSRQQVETPNFGRDTLDTIDGLMQTNRARFPNPQVAFNEVNGLNAIQIEGITDYGLTRTQVTTPNFGEHTLNAMNHLIPNRENAPQNIAPQDALNAIRGLNNIQMIGGLPNFEQVDLQMGDIPIARLQRAAFNVVRGLNAIQTEGLVNFRLNARQVLDTRLNEATLTNIQLLKQHYPEIKNRDLCDIVMNELLEHQVRGLILGILPEQLGFSLQENQLIHIDSDNIASGRSVDVIATLMQTEQMPVQQAFQLVQSLSNDQTSGITDIGLRLDQVQNPLFDRNEIIEEIANAIDNNEELGELEMPLNKVQQQYARELMDKKIASALQQEELANQKVAYPAVAAMPSSSENNSSSDEERDLSALTTAMQIKEGVSKQSSSKKEVKADKNSSKKKGPRPSGN
ncbi:hypothetical protein [Ascidiimonas sp. W6]|uniref:hypothetical protein n=1 Tax=Ascidiimonas meishanensis TaxID=3128903 RepID=UPI0030ED9223